MRSYLSFETPVAEIDARVDELRALAEKSDSPVLNEEVAKLEAKSAKTLADLYATLTPWQKIQVARVQNRPHFCDYVKGLITEFTPLSRRPQVRRGRRDRRRPRAVPRRADLHHRP